MSGLAALFAVGYAGQSVALDKPTELANHPGWVVMATPHTFVKLVERLEAAIKANKMGLVNAASASDGAKAQGFTIPGNRIVGVFRIDFPRQMLAARIPAGIEAPIRFCITEDAKGTATLSYRTPEAVFEPYLEGAGADLSKVGVELNAVGGGSTQMLATLAAFIAGSLVATADPFGWTRLPDIGAQSIVVNLGARAVRLSYCRCRPSCQSALELSLAGGMRGDPVRLHSAIERLPFCQPTKS